MNIRTERLNNRSMNLQLGTKTQLYNIPGIKDDLQEQEIHPKTNQQTGNSLIYNTAIFTDWDSFQ